MVNNKNEVLLSVTLTELFEVRSWLRAALAVERNDTARFATLLHLSLKVERLTDL